jgi:exopolyphosphatase/guanosine-5'-triphosphate,3'-diphosphate pyrophosphatase
MRLSAVDIGSNAVRFLFIEVINDKNTPIFKKLSLLRLPIRLGEDVFVKGKISKEKQTHLVEAFGAYKHLLNVFEVEKFRICATSAMRDAINGKETADLVKKQTGLNIEIIDGNNEATLIYDTHVAEIFGKDNTYLYVDVGGGSTELTLFVKGEMKLSHSFKIGTIRIKNDLVSHRSWDEMEQWIKQNIKPYKPKAAIGTGGNINKIYKMLDGKNYAPISYSKIKNLKEQLEEYTYEERIRELGLKPDRADVIIPAAKIYLSVMKWSGVKEMLVPKVGLADGIIHELYYTN